MEPVRRRPLAVLVVSLLPASVQVIYVVVLTAACVVNAVNMLSTITALIGRQIFTPEAKWSPLSFMKLTHEVRMSPWFLVLWNLLRLLTAILLIGKQHATSEREVFPSSTCISSVFSSCVRLVVCFGDSSVVVYMKYRFGIVQENTRTQPSQMCVALCVDVLPPSFPPLMCLCLLQAFREAIPQLEKLAAAAKPGLADASTLKGFAAAWKSVSFAHGIHSKHEDDVIFPALEAYFPEQVGECVFVYCTGT